MKRIPIATYSSVEELEAIIRQLEMDALPIPPDSEKHRNIMKQIAQFHVYADAKRWLFRSGKKRAA